MANTIKNTDTSNHTWGGVLFTPDMVYTLQSSQEQLSFANDSSFVSGLSSGMAQVSFDSVIQTDIASTIAALRGEQVFVKVLESPPFAKPDYRTKRDATGAWLEVAASETKVVDYVLNEERYVTGGEIIYFGAKKGDWIEAEVNDPYGYIPEPYRAALCENHPTVAKYIIKKWLKPSDSYESFTIDTYPLNAKISAGLSLRIVYHATSEAGSRSIAINYHLTKRLI
jgi:hypothetical protein